MIINCAMISSPFSIARLVVKAFILLNKSMVVGGFSPIHAVHLRPRIALIYYDSSFTVTLIFHGTTRYNLRAPNEVHSVGTLPSQLCHPSLPVPSRLKPRAAGLIVV